MGALHDHLREPAMSAPLPPQFAALLPSTAGAAPPPGAGALPPEYAALLPQKLPHGANPAAGSYPLQVGPWKTPITLPGWAERTLAGAGQGMTTIARHVGNLLGGIDGTSNAALARDAKLDAPLLKTPAGMVGNFLGETAALAPVGGGAEAALGKLGILGADASPIVRGVAQAIPQGFLAASPGHRIAGTITGAISGAALPALQGFGGKLVRGIARTPAAQDLLDEGVSLTPGQMNPRGIFNRMEQSAEALPVVGDLAQNARENAMGQYTRAMVQRSMAPGATLPPETTDFNDMIEHAARSFDAAYDPAKGIPVGPKIMNEGADVQLSKALENVANKPRIGLAAGDRASLGQQAADQLAETVKRAKADGGMLSDHLLALRSAFREAARGEDGLTNASRATRGFWKDAANKITDALESQITPEAAGALRDADEQYAKFAVMRDVARSVKDAPNGPTPFQISNAIAHNTPPNMYARGEGLNRDLAKAAREVFQSNVPRTGFSGVGRVLLPVAAGAGLTGLALSEPNAAKQSALPIAALAGLGALAYSPYGRAAFAGDTPLQKLLAAGVDRGAQAISPTLADMLGLYGRSALMAKVAPQLQGPPQ